MPHTWAPSSARAARAASLSAAPPGRRKCVEPKLHQAKHLTHHWWLRAGSEKQTFCISCEGKGTVMTNSLEFSRQMGSLKTILPSSADGISGIWSLMLLKQTCVALESGGPECCRAYLGERFPVAPCRSPGVSVSMRALKGCRVGGGGLWWLHPCKPCHFRPLTPPQSSRQNSAQSSSNCKSSKARRARGDLVFRGVWLRSKFDIDAGHTMMPS